MVHCVIKVLVIHIMFLYTSCLGIQCYQCDSSKDPNCMSSKLDKKYLRNCPDSHNYCRKIESTFYFKDPVDHLTIRECAINGTDGRDCYKGKHRTNSYQIVCECRNSHGCNSSSILQFRNYSILICSAIILLIFTRFIDHDESSSVQEEF